MDGTRSLWCSCSALIRSKTASRPNPDRLYATRADVQHLETVSVPVHRIALLGHTSEPSDDQSTNRYRVRGLLRLQLEAPDQLSDLGGPAYVQRAVRLRHEAFAIAVMPVPEAQGIGIPAIVSWAALSASPHEP